MRTFALLCLILFALANDYARAHDHELSAKAESGQAYWPGPAVSGSWYNPQRSGEGFVLEYLSNGTVLVIWFTFPATGEPGAQDWIIGEGGYVVGNRIRFDHMYRTFGGTWGDAFNPGAIRRVEWGTLEFEFNDCNSATFRYAGPQSHGSGERSMTRLTALDQIQCTGNRAVTSTGGRALSGLRSTSGAWYVPSRSGEGWYMEQLPGERLLVYWFTFDPLGHQAFVLGVGQRVEDQYEILDMHMTRGPRFGDAFDPASVVRSAWGRMTVSFSDCGHAEIGYQSIEPGYASGTRTATRLSQLAGTACIDGTPEALTQGSWQAAAPMPSPAQSELDATVLNGKLYALGGFGDPRGFKRYDPLVNQWETLTPLPSGRHHLSAFAHDGGVYYGGGDSSGGGEPGLGGYRYDVATNLWEPRPELPADFGSRAAVLHGRVFLGTTSGELLEYDPRQRISRHIANPVNQDERDHAQVQAFLGEIWIIGGRSPETSSVVIYDPASEQWRTGPRLRHFRGGAAATVVGHQLMISGGEVVVGTRRLEPSTEVYAAGTDAWKIGPPIPIPTHGSAAGAIGNRAYVVSGGTSAGSPCCASGRLFSIEFVPQAVE